MNVTIGGIARTVEITSFDKLGDVKVCMLTTTADGSVGFQQLNQEVIDTIYASFPVDTSKGSIASFEDGADNVPVRKLTLNLVPYQGGTGDPAPDNVRPIYPANGKNLLENVVTDDVKTIGGITYTKLSDGSVIANGTATSASFYCPDVSTASATPVTDHNMFLDAYMGKTLIVTGTPSDVGSANIRIMIGRQAGSSLANDIGSGATFTVSETGLWVGIRIENGTTVNNAHFYPMIRHAEITDASYVPYNAIGITRTGKNLYIGSPSFDGFDNISTYTKASETYNGHEVIYKATAWNGASNPIRVKEGYTYTFSAMVKVSVANSSVLVYSSSALLANKTIATANTWTRISGTYSATKDGIERFRIESASNSYTIYLSEYQLEVGSSATQYEPYTAERYYPISDNPVYGGTLEVETGVLTVTHNIVDLGTLNWTLYSVTQGNLFRSPNLNSIGYYLGYDSIAMICSNYPVVKASSRTDKSVSVGSNNCVDVIDSSYSTAAAFKTAMNGVQLVYELATPQTYQLTPTQVKTLLGYNNIWTDSGTVEVQYLANIGLYIQKIIGATEDDMVANQNISANKYFFVGEELYYSTSAISAGQTIVVGTNCIKTNLADALNALNS